MKSQSAITYLGVEGVSGTKSELISGATRITFLGGSAGDTTNCPSSGLCDTCELNDTFPCNESSVSPSSTLKISFKVDTAASFDASTRIRVRKGNNSETSNLNLVASSTTLEAGASLFAEVSWTTICGGTCSDFETTALYVGIDKGNDNSLDEKLEFQVGFRKVENTEIYHDATVNTNVAKACSSYEGLCGFEVLKGDEKVYLSETVLKIPETYPETSATSSILFKGVRLYFSTESFNSITPLSGYGSIGVSSSGELGSRTVVGLENKKAYYFLLANEDEAGNVYRVSPTGSGYLNNDEHMAIPEPVVGLLDDQNCFIATAAFGSPFEKHVQDLRQFRNEFLLTNSFGKAFVKFYYKTSPPIARWIAQNEIAKFVVRTALLPVWLTAQVALHFGWIPALFIFCMFLVASFALVFFVSTRFMVKLKVAR